MNTSEQLEKETEKWLEKLEKEIRKIDEKEIKNKLVSEEIVNIRAYISDCKHFLEKKDIVKAFEAVMYAWGIFDTLARMRLIKSTMFK